MGDRDTLHVRVLVLLILPGCLGDGWGVSYEKNPICTVRSSTVVILCQYTYPQKSMKVENVIWCKNSFCLKTDYVYHKEKEIRKDFEGRAEYLGDTRGNCTLKIKDIREEDSGNYSFRFEADDVNKWTAKKPLELKITELEVKITPPRGTEPIKEGENVTVICGTKNCNLKQSELTVLKNELRLPGQPSKLEFNSISYKDSGFYSCALKENTKISSEQIFLDIEYAPRKISVSVSPSGAVVAGSSVTLTCRSDANPPVAAYSWFKNNILALPKRESGQTYIISNISIGDSGQYHCVVQNKHGTHNSSAVTLSVAAKSSAEFLIILIVGIALTVLAVALVTTVCCKRRKDKGQTDAPDSTRAQAEMDPCTTRTQLPQRQDQSMASSSQEEVSYATIYFKKKQPKRSAQQQEQPADDTTIYSTVKK